jgi:hypothetical protein
MQPREHLFISYAAENATFAMWLARRLAAEGYLVWCDRLKLLGGQVWPRKINDAITDRSYLMLALMSGISVEKENPRGEWTLGVDVGKRLQREFVVPLRVDKFDYQRLGFQHINRQYVDFSTSWAQGLKDLFVTLDNYGAPRKFTDGKSVSARSFFPVGLVGPREESLITNFVRLELKSPKLLRFQAARELSALDWASLQGGWAFRKLKKNSFLALTPPPATFAEVFPAKPDQVDWDRVKPVYEVQPEHLQKELLWKTSRVLLVSGGAMVDEHDRCLYFPEGLFPKDWLVFPHLDGKSIRRAVVGTRTFRIGPEKRQIVKYNLGYRLETFAHPVHGWVLVPKLYVRVRGEAGVTLGKRATFSRSRAIARDWWNFRQLDMHLALLAFIKTCIAGLVGKGLDLGVGFNPEPVTYTVGTGIDESKLEAASEEDPTEEIETDEDEEEETEVAS